MTDLIQKIREWLPLYEKNSSHRELLSEAAEEIERLRDHLQTNHDIAVVSFSRAGVRHDKEACATCKVLGVIQKETP